MWKPNPYLEQFENKSVVFLPIPERPGWYQVSDGSKQSWRQVFDQEIIRDDNIDWLLNSSAARWRYDFLIIKFPRHSKVLSFN